MIYRVVKPNKKPKNWVVRNMLEFATDCLLDNPERQKDYPGVIERLLREDWIEEAADG